MPKDEMVVYFYIEKSLIQNDWEITLLSSVGSAFLVLAYKVVAWKMIAVILREKGRSVSVDSMRKRRSTVNSDARKITNLGDTALDRTRLNGEN